MPWFSLVFKCMSNRVKVEHERLCGEQYLAHSVITRHVDKDVDFVRIGLICMIGLSIVNIRT